MSIQLFVYNVIIERITLIIWRRGVLIQDRTQTLMKFAFMAAVGRAWYLRRSTNRATRDGAIRFRNPGLGGVAVGAGIGFSSLAPVCNALCVEVQAV